MASQRGNQPTLDELFSAYEEELANGASLAHAVSTEHLDSYESIIRYLSTKGSNRKNYRHYASRERVKSILDNSVFYLTDGSNWNDKYDRDNFNPYFSSYKRFGICLSATTSESIAMWMLYGGIDGNGAMINFDKKTLVTAASASEYECGYFDENKEFSCVMTLDAGAIDFRLIDVLYFGVARDDGRRTVERIGDKNKASISADNLESISQIAKHEAWSYETEVRLVAAIDKLTLAGNASKITAIKIPFQQSENLVKERVFDSPVASTRGEYRDSMLQGTVDWDLCSGCKRVSGAGSRR